MSMEFNEEQEIGTNGIIQIQEVDDGNMVIIRENEIWSDPIWSDLNGFTYKDVDYKWEDFQDAYLEDGEIVLN